MGLQEVSTWIDLGKDLLGAAGAVLAAVPWFADFRRRVRLSRLERVRAADQQTLQLIQETRAVLHRWHEGPSKRDLGFQLGGLALIAASFLMSLTKAMLLG